MKIRMPQHTLGLAFQRAARGHCVQNELHKETRKKRNQTTRVFDFYNAVLVHKRVLAFCWFWLAFYFFMLPIAMYVCRCSFSFSVSSWPFCVIFSVVAQTILAFFLWRQDCAHLWHGCFHPRRACFLMRAMHAAFQRLLNASALVS